MSKYAKEKYTKQVATAQPTSVAEKTEPVVTPPVAIVAATAEKKAYGERPTRTSLVGKMRTQYNHLDPSFEYHIFNDKPGRLEAAKEAGYEFETKGLLGDKMVEGGKLPGSVVSKPVGDGVTGYLMRKPKEWYEADMKPVLEQANRIEKQIKGESIDGFDNASTMKTLMYKEVKPQEE
jgi:hypothetical protein